MGATIDQLKNYYQLVIPDLPGSGQSEMLHHASIETYADVIKEIITVEQEKNKLSGDKNFCSVIGHSMGGYITLALAEKYPGVLNSFGLFHSSAFDSKQCLRYGHCAKLKTCFAK
ncbi:MAG: alpha/beta hydrolase [Chitinophagaceae bacterium]|nr:alpha/beta hydrolase [Chitinophagaceae bacterium]